MTEVYLTCVVGYDLWKWCM